MNTIENHLLHLHRGPGANGDSPTAAAGSGTISSCPYDGNGLDS